MWFLKTLSNTLNMNKNLIDLLCLQQKIIDTY